MASNTPKVMSSRLMTMKFMQRGAAKSSASEPSTPDGRPTKRARLSNGRSAPGTPGTPSDHEMLQSALAVEERKREEALNKSIGHSGETRWELSVQEPRNDVPLQGMRVVHAGFATIDAEDDESDEVRPLRMQFGGGLKKKKEDAPAESDDSEDASDSSSSDYDSDDPTAELIRETKRDVYAKEREERRARKREAAERTIVHGDASLKGLTSLSGSGGRGRNNVECYHCKGKGHVRSECPKLRRRSSGGGSRGNQQRY